MAGLIVAVVVAVIGVGYSQIKGMSLDHALLYVVLPLVVVLCAGGAWLGASRVARTFRDMRQTIDSLLDHAVGVNEELLRLHLRDVIADAENYGWTIIPHDEGLGFITPDGAMTYMRYNEIDPTGAARREHDLAVDVPVGLLGDGVADLSIAKHPAMSTVIAPARIASVIRWMASGPAGEGMGSVW